VARDFGELYDRYLGPTWRTDTDNQELWKQVDNIPTEELWREKQRRRVRLVLFCREYLRKTQKGYLLPDQLSDINEYLDPDALTIGFARRFATYKRALLIFRDMDKLSKILKDPERPVQIILSGKAHPHDQQGKEVIQNIIQKVRAYDLEKHVVFLEDYDMIIARYMVKGCDIWLNNPIRPMEASGTSGMKAAINGTINLSVLDGWWDEAYDGTNGFAIGTGEIYENPEEQDIIESESLYDILGQVIVPMFFERGANRVPETWISYMKNCIKSIAGRFSTARMIKDYTQTSYLPAFQRHQLFMDDQANKANEFKAWKEKVKSSWPALEIIDVSYKEDGEIYPGKKIKVSAIVSLGRLSPEDVLVQVYYGSLDTHHELVNTNEMCLELSKSEGEYHYYEGYYECPDTGMQGFTIRVLPTHPLLVEPAEMYLCLWAS
jgi:starch phosphorylase